MMNIRTLEKLALTLPNSARMPILFLGHGSPMNAIEDNAFTQNWQALGKILPTPKAILCISAHWETQGSKVTAMPTPKIIYDFYGFPEALHNVRYPASGSPKLARYLKTLTAPTILTLDHEWGLDHGAWAVLMHLYPKANIPVIQLSLDQKRPPKAHYELAASLQKLRDKGVLIIGSGNIVHNLRLINWQKRTSGFDWAEEARITINQFINDNNHEALINYQTLGTAVNHAIPTPEHFLPLLYTLALKTSNTPPIFFNDLNVLGSLSMTSLIMH